MGIMKRLLELTIFLYKSALSKELEMGVEEPRSFFESTRKYKKTERIFLNRVEKYIKSYKKGLLISKK